MRIILAPMEGVLDALVRELLSNVNDYDLCITEFIRVVNTLLPAKTYYRLCPELQHGGRTKSGTAVRVQLLGNSPEWMAENANKAIELGSHGIDINYGCPAKKVVGSDGGANLLRYPEKIYQITRRVRDAIRDTQPLSVKIRLGWDSIEQRIEIADAAQQGGANEIIVHGRTKTDGYQADKINWQAINDIRQFLTIPVIANGDIWNYQDGKNCLQITGCDALMVGRGAVSLPNLGSVIKHQQLAMSWDQAFELIKQYLRMENINDSGFYHLARTKQWLKYLAKTYPEAQKWFSIVRTIRNTTELSACILSA